MSRSCQIMWEGCYTYTKRCWKVLNIGQNNCQDHVSAPDFVSQKDVKSKPNECYNYVKNMSNRVKPWPKNVRKMVHRGQNGYQNYVSAPVFLYQNDVKMILKICQSNKKLW